MKNMKKLIVLCIISAFFIFQGSSPWEGAAAIAVPGELPETGRFVATNSFPRNTVVDITNVETNRTIRAIVVNNLENSGLLATVSREAAELIGMRAGSVGRIRMVQPPEPIAFQRFTHGGYLGFVHNPESIISEQELTQHLLESLFGEDTYLPPAPAQPPVTMATLPPYIADEPDWTTTGRTEVTDIPVFFIPHPDPVEPIIVETPVIQEYTPVIAQPHDGTVYTLVPTDEFRTPPVTDIYGIDPSLIIPGIVMHQNNYVATEPVVPIVTTDRVLSVRTISHLARGQFYVQITSHSTPALAVDAINQIDQRYNPGVFIGGDNIYRILIGPLNQGESAAILRRFRTIGYSDAFVRRGG